MESREWATTPPLRLTEEQKTQLYGQPRFTVTIEDLRPGSPKSFLDPNDWRVRGTREGMWFAPLAVRNGGRVSTRDCLRTAQVEFPGRLEIRTGALVSRVVFEGTRAVGVEYLDGRHLYRADPQRIHVVRESDSRPPATSNQPASAQREGGE